MKHSGLLAAALAVFAIAPAFPVSPSAAQETWILVTRRMRSYKPGTLGEVFCKEDRYCGEAIYVDAKSIVRSGDFAYFNVAIDMINANGFKTKPNEPLKPKGVEANCRAKTVNIPSKGWVSWSNPSAAWDGPAAQFACR